MLDSRSLIRRSKQKGEELAVRMKTLALRRETPLNGFGSRHRERELHL